MTAFGREQITSEWGTATWEIRSVNFRYLDISTRLPEDLRPLEQHVREKISTALTRGKIDATLKFQPTSSGKQDFRLNLNLVDQIASAISILDERTGSDTTLNSLDLLRWPGVLSNAEFDLNSVTKEILILLDKTVKSLISMRAREGEKIREFVSMRCNEAREITQVTRRQMPTIVETFKERLKDRLAETLDQINFDRLEQEIVILANKMDVSEELDRLIAHCDEVKSLLKHEKPVGRRLDFLMQELNREANTLGAKSADMIMTRSSVDLKVLIEQMREQIQNIE